jgi:hypothetical protein
VAASGAAAASFPAVALLLLAGALVAGGAVLAWTPGAEKLYAREGATRTANIVARPRRRASPARRTLILMAHHDSKSQSLTMPWRIGLTLVALAGAVVLFAVLARALLVPGAAGHPVVPVVAAIVAGALLALSTLRSDNRSPGGVDNAGSVAIVTELARRLPASLPEDVDPIFLVTGAEEDHMVGAMRWLDAHGDELVSRPVEALNFDGAGAPGRAVIVERYGLGKRFSPELASAARAAAKRLGVRIRRIWMMPGVGIDAIPFDHRGVPCLTFSSGSLDRATLSVHSSRDVADHLDPAALVEVAMLAEAVALEPSSIATPSAARP